MSIKNNEEVSLRIRASMFEVFQEYANVRDSKKEPVQKDGSSDGSFWDVVVLTTFDEGQKENIVTQLQKFKEDGRIPRNTRLEVVPDPPDVKLGSGGSTLHTIRHLEKVMGNQLYESKVLILHSGGSSQRLPSYSAQGKIFCPMPVKDLVPQNVALILDVKLAMYLPFCRILGNGVLVVGSDHIETYCLQNDWPGQQDLKNLRDSDFVALAHPSSIEIGTGHGVYIFEETDTCRDKAVCVREAIEVLQKPSEEMMRNCNAVIKQDDGSEMVYSDSIFWINQRIYKPLLKWYEQNIPLKEEMCAYNHMLPCLGKRNREKLRNSTKITSTTKNGVNYFSDMFGILKDCSLKIIVLNESKFTHFGTMKEYRDNFCYNPSFGVEMNLENNFCNVDNPWKFIDGGEPSSSDKNKSLYAIGSHFGEKCELNVTSGDHIILEWSNINRKLFIEDDVIMHGCTIDNSDTKLTIFGNCLYHTVPMKEKSSNGLFFITFAVNLDADIKFTSLDLSSIKYFGLPMTEVFNILKIDEPVEEKYSLWNLKMFPRSSNASHSFMLTHNLLNRLLSHLKKTKMESDMIKMTDDLYSLSDIITVKDLDALIERQTKLMETINDNRK